MADAYTPKELQHPQFRKGTTTILANGDTQGTPDLFPPVTVNNEQQEAFHRAKGYLAKGEAPPQPVDYAEYPVMLSHPQHEDAIPDDFDVKKGPGGEVISTRIPGKPETHPPVMAKSPEEEKAWAVKGYKRVGVADGLASQKAKASPFNPNFKAEEYPKMVDGKIVDPAGSMLHNRYPMYVGETLVHSAEEEIAARETMAPVLPVMPCVICGDRITAEEEWSNGAVGPYHTGHIAATANPFVKAVEKSSTRKEAGLKAAATRKAKKERAGQAAPQGE